jgi:heme exporter protein C
MLSTNKKNNNMWWKITGVALVLYALIAGMVVPLKSGIQKSTPAFAKTGEEVTLRFLGYNTFFSQTSEQPIRAWLTFDEDHALAAKNVKAVNDTLLEATFTIPARLPKEKTFTFLNVIVDHPVGGTALLPAGVEVRQDTGAVAATEEDAWKRQPVSALHVQKGFSFPYQNVIYESIRNTYYHVPMWFALMFMFIGSVWYSIQYLRNPVKENDRRAIAFTEMGIVFGLLGLFTGMVWANYAWGKPWSNDIKQLMTAVALLVYMAYFILRSSFDESEKGARLAAVYNIFAFASLIPLLYIVPRMFASLHPGATGNPAFGSNDLDNTMRLVFYPAIIGWSLIGLWITQLRYRYLRLQDRADEID